MEIVKICGIYKITSPSGRVYIGESENITTRWKDYNNLNNCKSQRRLHRSLKKYTVEEHIFEIIEECYFEDLLCRERYWQDEYDVLSKRGLNCRLTRCGDKKGISSEETKEKIRQANLGLKHPDWRNEIKSKAQGGENHWTKSKTFSEEAKLNMSEAQKELYKNGYISPLKGTKITKEHKELLRNVHSKKVCQYDLEGMFIKEWESVVSVKDGGFLPKYVIECCKNKRSKYKKYIWKYKKE